MPAGSPGAQHSPEARHSSWHTARPQGTVLGAGSRQEMAHKEGAEASLGRGGLGPPTPVVHFLGLACAGLCPGSCGGGEGWVAWEGRMCPAGNIVSVPRASSQWGRRSARSTLEPNRAGASTTGHPQMGQKPVPWPPAQLRRLVPRASGAHPAMLPRAPRREWRQARSCCAVPGARGTRRRWLAGPRGALLFAGGARRAAQGPGRAQAADAWPAWPPRAGGRWGPPGRRNRQ